MSEIIKSMSECMQRQTNE